MILMLKDLRWIPDINLYKKEEGIWNIWNLFVSGKRIKIIDFTYYYDPFRLYHQRCEEEVHDKMESWGLFLEELGK